jgi:hypothetical protein
MVLDAIADFLWDPCLAGERLPGPSQIAIRDDGDYLAFALPPRE